MILAKCYQQFLPKYKILVSQAQTIFFFFFIACSTQLTPIEINDNNIYDN